MTSKALVVWTAAIAASHPLSISDAKAAIADLIEGAKEDWKFVGVRSREATERWCALAKKIHQIISTWDQSFEVPMTPKGFYKIARQIGITEKTTARRLRNLGPNADLALSRCEERAATDTGFQWPGLRPLEKMVAPPKEPKEPKTEAKMKKKIAETPSQWKERYERAKERIAELEAALEEVSEERDQLENELYDLRGEPTRRNYVGDLEEDNAKLKARVRELEAELQTDLETKKTTRQHKRKQVVEGSQNSSESPAK